MMSNFLVRILAHVLKPVILEALEPSAAELAEQEARRAQRKAERLEQDRILGFASVKAAADHAKARVRYLAAIRDQFHQVADGFPPQCCLSAPPASQAPQACARSATPEGDC